MWKRAIFCGLVLFAGRSSVHSYVGSVEIVPPRPTPGDDVTVRVKGDLPDPCWKLLGSSVERTGARIAITAETERGPGLCAQVLVPYGFEEDLGRLAAGSYEVTVTDSQGSKTVSFEVAPGAAALAARFQRGDSNVDGGVDISDAIGTLVALFAGGARLGCEDAADANDDGAVDVSDAVFTLLALFGAGKGFPVPGSRACGPDPTADGLGCESFAPCGPLSGEVFRLIDTGIVCLTTPCPYYKVVDGGGLETEVSDLDLTALNLSPEEEKSFLDRLAKAPLLVRAYLLPGPEGPAGLGTTLVVLEELGPG